MIVSSTTKTVGIETTYYARRRTSTGVERVIHHIHSDLDAYWKSKGINLAPMTCQKELTHALETMPNDLPIGGEFVKRFPVEPNQCDAILLLDIDNNIDFRALKKISFERNLPIIAFIHDVLPLHYPEWFPEHGKRNFQVYLQQTLYAATHLIVTTEKVKSDILNLGWRTPTEISIVPLGSSLPKQSVSTHELTRISIFYVSTVEPRKGHDVLLDAFDILLDQGEDVDLTLVGHEGWMVDDLITRIINHEEFDSRLKWFRGISDEDVCNLAREANIGVMPSQGEGFGLFIEEGLTLGLKVVASAIPEFLERSQSNLSFFEGNADSLAQAIVKAHKTPYVECSLPRSMRDFSYEFSTIVEQAMTQKIIGKGDR